ncbi:cathepsin L1-like [Acipenser oxyrinchus oxyrinchus]|uniref:Cathepsin L1-like n=1 Tax=Acipenser oxyrinchus oxyrinchus TaxID=40147 RepID=A0AAD8CGS4_ACIOX|nr:cathepsin L1-like [Acipenser oxyrinchus oxyrinchus]
MQVFVVFLVAVVTAVAAASSFSKDPALEDPWQEWKGLHGKQYSEETESYRRMVWEDNWRFIEQHNQEHAAGKHSYKLGMNHFGDLTNEEFNRTMNRFHQDPALEELPVFNSTGISSQPPREMDWRNKGYVTPVKNQGRCGSCWAFSATGAVEGQHFKKTGRLVSLSEQNLVECTKNKKYMNYGCNGGLMGRAFQYIIDNRGIASERRYPYTAKDNKPCRYSASMKAARVSSYCRVPNRNEKALRDAVVAIGPISTCLNAGRRTFQFYRSGIYYDPKCGQSINHAVLAVGYGVSWFGSGSSRPTKFWLLKNSWGRRWGNRGYFRLARDKNNHCGIANQAVYPVI